MSCRQMGDTPIFFKDQIKRVAFKIRVQRNKFLFKCANIFQKKAFGLAQTTPMCAVFLPF